MVEEFMARKYVRQSIMDYCIWRTVSRKYPCKRCHYATKVIMGGGGR